jgi:hypothetical protein
LKLGSATTCGAKEASIAAPCGNWCEVYFEHSPEGVSQRNNSSFTFDLGEFNLNLLRIPRVGCTGTIAKEVPRANRMALRLPAFQLTPLDL